MTTPPPILDLVDLYRLTVKRPTATIRLTEAEAEAIETDIAHAHGDHFPPHLRMTDGRIVMGATVAIVTQDTLETKGRFQ